MLLIDNVDDDDDHGVYGDVAGYGARNHAVAAAAADDDSAGGGFGGDNINEDGNNDEYHKRLMLR